MQRSPQPVNALDWLEIQVEWPAFDQRSSSCLITFKLPMLIDIASDSCVANVNKTIRISYASPQCQNPTATEQVTKPKVNIFYAKSFHFIKTLNVQKNIAISPNIHHVSFSDQKVSIGCPYVFHKYFTWFTL